MTLPCPEEPARTLPPDSAGARPHARTHLAVAVTLVVLHFAAVMTCFEPALSSPDGNGYSVQARLLATEGRSDFASESPVQYVGPHWLHSPGDRYASKYPPGFPVLMAAAWRVLGPTAALAVNPVMASLTLLALFLVCRAWVDGAWALFAVACMAVCPMPNEHALVGDAHTSVAFFLMWGLFALTRWRERPSPGWAFAAGLLLGVIPSLRYAEALLLPGCGLFVGLAAGRDRRTGSLLAFAAGALLPLGALCLRNHAMFGAFWSTGYGLTREQTGFGAHYLARHWGPYLQKLLTEGSGPPFLFGIAGIAWSCARAETRHRGVLLASLVVPTTLLYMSYYWPPDPQSMRFLLPTLFLYPIAAAWTLHECAPGRTRAVRAIGGVLLLATLAWGVPGSVRSMLRQKFPNAVLAEITRALELHVPPGSVVIADELIQQHLDFVGRWRLVDASVLAPPPERPPGPAARDANGPDPMQAGKSAERDRRYAGLPPERRFEAFAQDVRAWAGSRRIFWVGDDERIDPIRRLLSAAETLRSVARIERPSLPPPPDEPITGHGGGAGAPPAGGPMAGIRRLMAGAPLQVVEWETK